MKAKNENKHIALCIAMFIIGTFLVALTSPYGHSQEFVWQHLIGFAGIIMIMGSGLLSFFKILFLSGLNQKEV